MHKDATGREIKRGSYIAYVVSTGTSGGVKFGAVVKLKQEDVQQKQTWDHTTNTWIMKDVTEYTIQIISVDKSWKTKWVWSLQGKKEGKFARVQHIANLDRVILLEPHQMDPGVKEILDKELMERGV